MFLVRKGNPKAIRNWDDLVKPGVSVITPTPRHQAVPGGTTLLPGAMRYASPAAPRALQRSSSRRFSAMCRCLTRARGATTTFAQRGIGDVLLAWENEAFLAARELGAGKFEVVVPSLSILAEPSVSLVDANVDRRKTRAIAQSYLEFLYTPQAQDIIGKNYYRPRLDAAAQKYAGQFPKLTLLEIDRDFGGWTKAQRTHFNDGGLFDQIYTQAKR
ncbi:sulfate ABC transporter substrate-binding protein [Hankyongella ginsenosidimutans]|uniref:sulfate ABC transporter substrate-binding protein n=1 Tax=Hankyongella ginsenosidimutans TaxID=1763828 RepID=UPI00248230F3|nr:sulfate ABC transporter substrate-binding protein [Hankyongella ginsenosidimutans]